MKIIQLGRGEGKTTWLIAWLMRGSPLPTIVHSWDRALLVSDQRRAELIRDDVHRRLGRPVEGSWDASNAEHQASPWARYQVIQSNVITPASIRSVRWHPNPNVTLAIDELDDVLYALFTVNVELVTLTPEP